MHTPLEVVERGVQVLAKSLVSLDAVMAAGEEDLWTEVPCPPLPGVTRKIVLMGLKAGGS